MGPDLLISTYDEHGGYYDHVPPPPRSSPTTSRPLLQPGDLPGGYDRYGFRVPPSSSRRVPGGDYVSHVVHDHTSISRSSRRSGTSARMTYRDANAADMLDCLDFRRAELPGAAGAAPRRSTRRRACGAAAPRGTPPLPPAGAIA